MKETKVLSGGQCGMVELGEVFGWIPDEGRDQKSLDPMTAQSIRMSVSC